MRLALRPRSPRPRQRLCFRLPHPTSRPPEAARSRYAKDPWYLDLREGGGNSVYRVRAVNEFGDPGPWSKPVPDAALGRPGDTPTVLGVKIASAPGAGDSYQLGETIALEVTFSDAVQVQGIPTLALEIGDTTRQVPMSAHRGDTLTFRYTVAAGDLDTDGISVPENGLTLPDGATITNVNSRTAAALKAPGLGNQAGHKVNAPGGEPDPPPPYYVDVPAAPSSLTATPGNGYVTLEWAPYCCDQKDIFYQLWRGDAPTWRNIPNSDRTTSQYIVSGLTNGDTYHFRVRTVYRHRADDGTITEHPGAASRTVAATPSTTPAPPGNRAPVFQPDTRSFSVVERAPRGTEVARVRATDADGDSLTYTLTGENSNKFSIANVSGEGVIRVAEAELSYTWEPGGVSFNIGVEVTDDRGGRANWIVGVEVTASERRNNAPVAEEPGTLYVSCGAMAETTVGTIKATDPEGDSLWYILVSGAEYFKFEGGTTVSDVDSFWDGEHAKLVSDGSGVVLKTAKDLPNAPPDSICKELITVVVEVEEEGNPGNNDTLVFEVRVDDPPATSRSTGSDEGGTSVLAAVRSWAGSVRDWWTGFWAWADWGDRRLAARP